MKSLVFIELLEDIKQFMDEDISREQELYTIGKSFLSLRNKDEDNISHIKKLFGENWKPLRFRNLVRLGADIENAAQRRKNDATWSGALLANLLDQKFRQYNVHQILDSLCEHVHGCLNDLESRKHH